MVLCNASELTKSFGANELFSKVSFAIDEGDKIGLIGPNGCGKTTLLRILCGEQQADGGVLHRSKLCRVGYLRQNVGRTSEHTLREEMGTAFDDLRAMEQELAQLANQIEQTPDPALISRQHRLHEAFEERGGYTYESRLRAALMGLGFSQQQWELPMSALSGGQQTRAELGKVLLSDSNFLLLDEPTNHLDMSSVQWLEDFLRDYRGAVLCISHDRYFLDRVTRRTFELSDRTVQIYQAPYTEAMDLKERRRKADLKKQQSLKREAERIEGIIAQQKQWNREKTLRVAHNKEKQLERLQEQIPMVGLEPEQMRFTFPCRPGGGNEVLCAKKLAKRYGTHTLFAELDLEIRRGDRLFLLGPNGCGKTTLVNILLGKLRPDEGTVIPGAGIVPAYYEQNQSALLTQSTVLNEVWSADPGLTQTQVRSALGAFLFHGEEVFQSISTLSGGERARVALLKVMLADANFLILDEPTNHLDLYARAALEEALRGYEGTLLCVTHDRYLVNRLATHLCVLDGENAVHIAGGYDDYLSLCQQRTAQQLADSSAAAEKPQSESKEQYLRRKELDGAIRRAGTRIKRAEEQIEHLERKQKELELKQQDPAVSCDYQEVARLAQEMEHIQTDTATAMAEWEQASTLLEQLTVEADADSAK